MWQSDLKSYARAFSRFAFSSLRARLLILVFLVIIPSLALIIYIAGEQRLQGLAQARERTLKAAREAASQQQRSIDQARDFLSELAHYLEIDHPRAKACPAFLAKKLKEHPEYANVFVLALDGEVVCSARSFVGRVNASDRLYFQMAVARQSFSVGEYQIGRVTGKATIAFGHPVLDETGKFTAVLAASLDLAHLSDLINDARLPKNSAMLLIDGKGTVLVHHPDPQRIIGKSITDQPLVRRLLSTKGEEIDQQVGLDGIHRLYAFAPIRVGGDTRAYLGMGIPIEVAFADADRTLRRNLILLGLVSLLALGAAWFEGEFFILRRVNDLVNATGKLASGDLSARTALPHEKSELGQLARAFDGMAESLQKRQAEIDRAQKTIHYSDQRFRMMVEAVQDYAIIMLDPDGYVVSWNSGAERINGYQAKEIVGRHFSCFYPPEDIEHGRPEHGLKVASSEGRFEDEGWRLRKDGSRFWANVAITPVRDDRGQLIAYSKVTHDLTERKRAEEALHARYRELQILYQIGQSVLNSPDLKTALEKILDEAVALDSFDLGTILLVDSSGEKINTAASRGYRDPANIKRRPSEEKQGIPQYGSRAWQKISVVENVAQTEGLRTLKREGVQSAVLTPVRAGEKTLGFLQVGSRTRRQFDADKVKLLEAIGNHLGVAIQKSSLYEEAKRNLERIGALHDINLATTSTLNLQTILDGLLEKIGLFIPSPSAATVRLVNKENGQWEAITCRNIDEDEWKSQVVVTPNGRAARVLKTKRPFTVRNIQTDPLTYNPSLYRNHGLISYLGVPLIVKDEAVGVLNLYTKEEHEFSDEEVQFLVTLAGQAAVAIQNAQMFAEVQNRETELKRANKIKDEFLSIVSHELRTPLNVIMGYSGLLVEGMFGELSREQNNAAQTVMSQSKDLLTLVNHILQATQIDCGDMPVSKTAVNLTGFLDELKIAYDLPTKKQLTIDWDYPLDLPSVETDSGKLKEILQNLLNNAIKFTEEGTVSITARYRPEAETVVLRVADTGAGIPKELVPIIFEKFRQVDGSNTRLHGGVGLGLYIVKKYTELIGGEVEVKSELGMGSTFTVTIPCETARYTTWQDDRFEQTL